MKIHPFQIASFRKMYVSYPASKTVGQITATQQSEEPVLISEQKKKAQSISRKAFVGNYFAGPHCLFHPGLF